MKEEQTLAQELEVTFLKLLFTAQEVAMIALATGIMKRTLEESNPLEKMKPKDQLATEQMVESCEAIMTKLQDWTGNDYSLTVSEIKFKGKKHKS